MLFVCLLAVLSSVALSAPSSCVVRNWAHVGCNSEHFSRSFHATDEMKAQGKGRQAMKQLIGMKMKTHDERVQCHKEDRCHQRKSMVGARTPCVDGMAGDFPCSSVDLLSFLNFDDLGFGWVPTLVEGNDLWVWHDLDAGDDYVIMGTTHGSSFVRVTDRENPEVVGILPSHNDISSSWRDMKVVGDFVFIVSEASGHGMQVFDMTRLRGLEADNTRVFENDVHYDRVGNTHNIVANPENNRVFLVGSTAGSGEEICNGGPHIVDVSDPLNPEFVTCYGGDGYTHDAQCMNYDGPDTRFNGREICFCYNEDTFTVIDTTDGDNVILLDRKTYEGNAYSHQGWNTEDNTYALLDDELDEFYNQDKNTTTFVWDITNLEDVVLVNTHIHGQESSDHNMYIKADYAHQSNYKSGYRLISLANLPDLSEAAFFDVYPEDVPTTPGFSGTWSNYPYFEDGAVAVSSIDDGLFMLQPNWPEIEKCAHTSKKC